MDMRLETELLEYVTFISHPFVLRPISDISFHSGKKKKGRVNHFVIYIYGWSDDSKTG